MQNGDETSPSIILAGRALLVKMLITLEPCGIIGSNFVHQCILTFLAAGMENSDKAPLRFTLAC